MWLASQDVQRTPNVCFAPFWVSKTPKRRTQVHKTTEKISKIVGKWSGKEKREILAPTGQPSPGLPPPFSRTAPRPHRTHPDRLPPGPTQHGHLLLLPSPFSLPPQLLLSLSPAGRQPCWWHPKIRLRPCFEKCIFGHFFTKIVLTKKIQVFISKI